MKNLKLLFLAVASLLAGCTYHYTEQPQKNQTSQTVVPVVNNRQIIDLQANNADWANNGSAYYAQFDIPELTQEAYDNAVVLCYAEFNTGTANAYQEQLPFTFFDQSENTETGEIFQWSRLIDFDYTIGSMTIYYTNNDFNYLDGEPGDWHFRLVLLW